MIKFVSPIVFLIDIFTEKYPNKDASVELVSKMEGCYGETCFANDGKVYIQIDVKQSIEQILDILAHELAHLQAGIEADHGEQWKKVYDNLVFEFNKRYLQEVEKELE